MFDETQVFGTKCLMCLTQAAVAEYVRKEADAEAASSLRFRYKVTETHDVVHEEDARDFVESLHAIRKFRVHRLKVNLLLMYM